PVVRAVEDRSRGYRELLPTAPKQSSNWSWYTEQLGVSMGIDSDYFCPSLWQLYESQFPEYFFASLLCRY
ncbi:MAG: hypothetical protein ACKPKO_55795, partial [Candidatus Fonsibacter sp.]